MLPNRCTIDRAYAVALDLIGQNRRTLDALAAGYLDRSDTEAVQAKLLEHRAC